MLCRRSSRIRRYCFARTGSSDCRRRVSLRWRTPDSVSAFRLLVKNSAANIAAGAANALLAVVLPPVLVRHLASAEFSTWSVVLQLAAVVYVFQFGVQVAVGRYVAYCTARQRRGCAVRASLQWFRPAPDGYRLCIDDWRYRTPATCRDGDAPSGIRVSACCGHPHRRTGARQLLLQFDDLVGRYPGYQRSRRRHRGGTEF